MLPKPWQMLVQMVLAQFLLTNHPEGLSGPSQERTVGSGLIPQSEGIGLSLSLVPTPAGGNILEGPGFRVCKSFFADGEEQETLRF